MIENIEQLSEKKVKLDAASSTSTDALLFGDDPRLHRLIKQRILKKLSGNTQSPQLETIDAQIPKDVLMHLIEEVELQNIDFIVANEKLNPVVFEKILLKIAHLDFRSFSNAQQQELTLYDPNVITPQVSWAIEQIFKNLPGFFRALLEMEQHDENLISAHTDIVRNVFILGHMHGYLNDEQPHIMTIKQFLAHSIRESEKTDQKLKPYPLFLKRLVDANQTDDVSPRLTQLKKHWQQQLARRWLLLVKTDEASPNLLSLATQKQVGGSLPIDRRPAENLMVAKKQDALMEAKGIPPANEAQSTEATQIREELSLHATIEQTQQSSIAHMRSILGLYQGDGQDLFHDGHRASAKWLTFQTLAEPLLHQLVYNFKSLQETKSDVALDLAIEKVIAAMIRTLYQSDSSQVARIKQLFGADFFTIAKVEQLALLSFTAMSFVQRETKTIKIAIQILDRIVVPRLNRYFDLDQTQKLSENESATLSLAPYDKTIYTIRSAQAKTTLNSMQLEDGLISTDSTTFQKTLKEQQQTLVGIAKFYSFFASLTSENWGDRAKMKPIFMTLIFLVTATISGYLNFNLSHSLLANSLEEMVSEDLLETILKFLPTLLTVGSGSLLLGTNIRDELKKLQLSSPRIKKELHKFLNREWRQIATLLFCISFTAASTFPLWENRATEWWNLAKDKWEEIFNNNELKEQENNLEKTASFWEDRNPEAQNPKDLLNVEKTSWGKIIIGENVYGKSKHSPIGFINTYISSPAALQDGNQQFARRLATGGRRVDAAASNMLIQAQDYYVNGDTIVFTLKNGEKLIKHAAGTDFVIVDWSVDQQQGFTQYLDTGRYLDQVIAVSELNYNNTEPSYSYYEHPNQTQITNLAHSHELIAIYKTNPEATNEISKYKIRLEDNLAYWQGYVNERKIIIETLQHHNPVVAEMYVQMQNEHESFWGNYDSGNPQHEVYQQMIVRQISSYSDFVQKKSCL